MKVQFSIFNLMTWAAALICLTIAACDQPKGWTTTRDHDFIINDMAFRITEAGAVLVCLNPELAGHVVIPDTVFCEETGESYTVIDIQEYGLNKCTRITSIKVPDTVVDISWVFDGCTNLKSVNIPLKATRMVGAFCGCASLTSVTIPDNMGYIGGAFEGCSSLTEVRLPENEEFTYILGGTFAGCRSLTSITIPPHVQRIYRGAFEGCEKLAEVHCQALQAPEANSEGTLYRDFFAMTDRLYVPEGSRESYEATYPWNEFKEIIEE